MNYGNAIKETRNAVGLTQVEVCAVAGITQTYLSQIESGSKTPTIHTIESLAKAMKVPVVLIFCMAVEKKDYKEIDKFLAKLEK